MMLRGDAMNMTDIGNHSKREKDRFHLSFMPE